MESESNKILPVRYPMITTYTQHAHLLSILENHECAYSWIFSNYIQLYINKDYEHKWGDFYFPFPYELRPSDTCKWIHTQKIHRDNINSTSGGVINFLIECISSNNYVHTMINLFHVPLVGECYNKINFLHDTLVYGFDLDKEILYVADFFIDGKYNYAEISFSDFNQAFVTYNLASTSDYLNGMAYLYKFNDKCDYKFHIENITNSIKAYLSSAIPEYWDIYNNDNRKNIVFGVEIYNTLKKYIKIVTSSGAYNIDIRPFYMLYDHKMIMSLRLKYLHEQGYLENCDIENITNIDKIVIRAKCLVDTIIKYTISKNNALVDKLINMLNDIEKKEYDILKSILDSCKTN